MAASTTMISASVGLYTPGKGKILLPILSLSYCRRTSFSLLSTKTDDDIDAEAREISRHVDDELKKDYERRGSLLLLSNLLFF